MIDFENATVSEEECLLKCDDWNDHDVVFESFCDLVRDNQLVFWGDVGRQAILGADQTEYFSFDKNIEEGSPADAFLTGVALAGSDAAILAASKTLGITFEDFQEFIDAAIDGERGPCTEDQLNNFFNTVKTRRECRKTHEST